MNEILIGVLSGGAAAALIKLLDNVIVKLMDRKGVSKTARLEDIKKSVDSATSSIEKVADEQKHIGNGVRILMSERLNSMFLDVLNKNEITLSERKEMLNMHDIYHSLGGNGDYDELLKRIMALNISTQ